MIHKFVELLAALLLGLLAILVPIFAVMISVSARAIEEGRNRLEQNIKGIFTDIDEIRKKSAESAETAIKELKRAIRKYSWQKRRAQIQLFLLTTRRQSTIRVCFSQFPRSASGPAFEGDRPGSLRRPASILRLRTRGDRRRATLRRSGNSFYICLHIRSARRGRRARLRPHVPEQCRRERLGPGLNPAVSAGRREQKRLLG
jgi:hypothetical protein